MAEYVSHYKVEGFDNPTMATVFKDLLMVKSDSTGNGYNFQSASSSTSANGVTCPAGPPLSPGQTPLTLDDSEDTASTSFLKSLILQQKATVDSLITTAKKIGPVANSVFQKKLAYDAAFESDAAARLPNASSTLQGFTLFLFFTSYIALVIVGTIAINSITHSTYITFSAFVGFVTLGVGAFALIIRLG